MIRDALFSSESNEWYTPEPIITAARQVLGTIDLDPASCAVANEVIGATKYFTKQENGLLHRWPGRIFMNPPYGTTGGKSNQAIWSDRLISQYEQGITEEAILLVNAATSEKWFQPLFDYLICFTNHRIRFYKASGESSQPTHGNALVYFGKNENRFIEGFSEIGRVMKSVPSSRTVSVIRPELW